MQGLYSGRVSLRIPLLLLLFPLLLSSSFFSSFPSSSSFFFFFSPFSLLLLLLLLSFFFFFFFFFSPSSSSSSSTTFARNELGNQNTVFVRADHDNEQVQQITATLCPPPPLLSVSFSSQDYHNRPTEMNHVQGDDLGLLSSFHFHPTSLWQRHSSRRVFTDSLTLDVRAHVYTHANAHTRVHTLARARAHRHTH